MGVPTLSCRTYPCAYARAEEETTFAFLFPRAQVEKYVQCLVKCFKEKLGKTVLIYERNTPSKAGQVHCHLQVVPVPEEKEDSIGEHVLECGRQSNIEFEPNLRWRDEEDLENYVVYDIPSKKSTYLHKIPQVFTCMCMCIP